MTTATTELDNLVETKGTQELTYFRTLLYAAIVGAAGGVVATVYYFLLEFLLELVWETGRASIVPWFPAWLPHWHYTWIVATIGGFGVGLCLYLLGLPGEMALVIDRVHDAGRLEPEQTPGMIATSLVSITAGGSLGPEAPLVQINGSVGSWLSAKLKLSTEQTRILTFCGMGAALAAFFGDPVGGPLFALEIPHRRGLEYYEAIIPAMVAGLCSFAIFRIGTGLEVGGIYNFGRFGELPTLTWVNLVEGIGLGLVGALAGILFIALFRRLNWMIQKIEHRHILLALMGGLGIGWIAV
ncbi:MAG: chloride channel protein, partial [Cyanobacteria bacterium P01_D01_bin.115]